MSEEAKTRPFRPKLLLWLLFFVVVVASLAALVAGGYGVLKGLHYAGTATNIHHIPLGSWTLALIANALGAIVYGGLPWVAGLLGALVGFLVAGFIMEEHL